jgi:hypothetical protein
MLHQGTVIPTRTIVRNYQKLFKEEASGKVLWDLAQQARQLTEGKELPTDLSTRHDDYLWETND